MHMNACTSVTLFQDKTNNYAKLVVLEVMHG